jgi:hypothetical protein
MPNIAPNFVTILNLEIRTDFPNSGLENFLGVAILRIMSPSTPFYFQLRAKRVVMRLNAAQQLDLNSTPRTNSARWITPWGVAPPSPNCSRDPGRYGHQYG